MLEDLRKGAILDPQLPGRESLDKLLRDRKVSDIISYPAWTRIDAMEVARGESQGRPRVKSTQREEFSEELNKG